MVQRPIWRTNITTFNLRIVVVQTTIWYRYGTQYEENKNGKKNNCMDISSDKQAKTREDLVMVKKEKH